MIKANIIAIKKSDSSQERIITAVYGLDRQELTTRATMFIEGLQHGIAETGGRITEIFLLDEPKGV